MKAKFGIILWVLLLSQLINAQTFDGKSLLFENLSVNSGLSHSDVNAIVQDRDGFMWFGTYNGLCKYSGKMTVYRSDNSALSNNRILSLYAGNDSLLYIGTETGGLNIYNLNNNSITAYRNKAGDETSLAGDVVNNIFEDSSHRIWICTDSGLSCINRGKDNSISFTSFYPEDFQGLIICGMETEPGKFIIGATSGILSFDSNIGKFQFLYRDDIDALTRCIIRLSSGDYLVGSSLGLFRLSGDLKNITRISSQNVLSLLPDVRGGVWMGTFNDGLYFFDKDLNAIAHYKADNTNPNSIRGDEPRTLFVDKSGVLWVGTIGEGINKTNIYDKPIQLYTASSESESGLNVNRIITFTEDRNNLLWVGTRGGGIEIMNPKTGKFMNLNRRKSVNRQLADISAFYQDKNGAMWVGTWSGLYVIPASQVASILETDKVNFDIIDIEPQGIYSSVYKIVEDADNYLWISTSIGVYCYMPDSVNYYRGKAVHYTSGKDNRLHISDNFVTDILVDSHSTYKTIWIGTRKGLDKLMFTPEGIKIEYILPDGDNGFCGEFISTIHLDNKGELWVATLGGGLNKMLSGRFDESVPRFEAYNNKNYPFVNNEFESLQEDSYGNFWIGGYGILRFNPSTGDTHYYTVKDRLQSNSFKIWASCRLRNGKMVFGGVNGFNIFHPDSIKNNQVVPQVVLTDFKIFNHSVAVGDTIGKHVILPQSLVRCKNIELEYDQNNLTFEFAALHYVSPEHNQFRYRLEGADKEWQYTQGKQAYATYTNLRPGEYNLVIYGANSDGVWNETGTSLQIKIHPPFWQTNYAYAFYIFMFILFLYLFQRSVMRKSEQRHRLEIERKLYIEEQKNYDAKLKFFTDISHEIKTPLSLIAAPFEELLSNPMLGNQTKSRLRLMSQNVHRLMKLVEQIMDFRKYDNSVMKMEVVETDFVPFIKEIAALFKLAAAQRHITIECDLGEQTLPLYADREKMEKVFINLLSNSLKFTPDGGRIRVSYTEDATSVCFCIEDNGAGIAPGDLEKIFDRFYQGSNSGSKGGTGIGLALSRLIIEQHKGRIWAESEYGQGSRFYFSLLKGKEHYLPEEIVDKSVNELSTDAYNVVSNFTEPCAVEVEEVGNSLNKETTILITEDNDSLRQYLAEVLGVKYRILEAPNGKVAYEIAITELPDLVVTDIMMPEMTGLELCSKLKENLNTSHIPVLMLTARDVVSYQIEGYKTGADAYVTKPFSVELLKTLIKRLIESRQQMKMQFQKQIELKPSEITVTTADERLLKKCLEAIEEHITEPEFGVDELCAEIGISRPQLYRKIKSLTDMSAIQFIRSIRLKRAAQILLQDNSSVSEVMYSVGFNNLSYFCKIFKEEFGCLPKKFKENHD